jgi:nucleotide-binding universal stress UspA family protein
MQTMNVKRILIPVNLLNGSFDVLQFAQGLAAAVPIHATLLNVVNLNVVKLEYRIFNEVLAESEAGLKKLAKHFFGNSPSVRINVRMGRPHEEIVAEAEAELSELIIMASPEPSRWKRFLGLARSSAWFTPRAARPWCCREPGKSRRNNTGTPCARRATSGPMRPGSQMRI